MARHARHLQADQIASRFVCLTAAHAIGPAVATGHAMVFELWFGDHLVASRLGVAWLNGQFIAARFWIVANGKADIYKLAYDERYKGYAAGTLLSAMLMQHAITVDKVTAVDYLSGDDPYKKSWMTHRPECWGIVAYNPRTLLGLLGLFKECFGRLLRSWLQTKAL